MEHLSRYFDNLTPRQHEQYAMLPALYAEWNAQINVISRKDIDNFFVHHLLHSLAIARVQPFKPMTDILDLGTGGGFPGIPLAIMFPQTRFLLVDSIGKKTKVVRAVADALALQNVEVLQARAETINRSFDFVVTRAVAPVDELVRWCRGKISHEHYHTLKNGLLMLKGGDLDNELKPFRNKARVFNISDYFDDPYFDSKKLIYLPL